MRKALLNFAGRAFSIQEKERNEDAESQRCRNREEQDEPQRGERRFGESEPVPGSSQDNGDDQRDGRRDRNAA
jgi:hypothetical protein